MSIHYQGRRPGFFRSLISLLVIGLILYGLYFVFSAFTRFLYWAAPVLFILALIVRYKVVINYFKFLGWLLQHSVLWGAVAVALSLVFYPFVAFYLFLKALRPPDPMLQEPEESPFFIDNLDLYLDLDPDPDPSEFTEYEELDDADD